MPSVITDPQAYAQAIIARRKALQAAQSGSISDVSQMSPFMQGITGNTDAPPTAGWQPSLGGVMDTLKSLVPQSMRPPSAQGPVDAYPDPRAEALRNQGSGVVDPAQAAAQGFRIPGDYIPAAQTAGGSGNYMSNVDNGAPVSGAQTAGGSGDYMSKVGQQADPMTTGSVAPPDNSHDYFSFFGKPQATDAMTAFGAAMLKGSNFREGLANAATAVNDVSKQYRPYTPEELHRMVQEAEIKRIARAKAMGTQVEWSRPLYDDKGQLYYPAQDSNGGAGFYNSATGQIEASIKGGLRAEDSTKKYESKQNVKDATTARDAAVDSYQRINQADQLLELYDSAGGGAGALNKISREASQFFNTDLLGVKVGDTQRIDNIIRQMELTQAQTQRGLGQLTEAERQIIRDALPKLDQDPNAFKAVVETLKRQSERARTIYTNWAGDKSLQQKYPNIQDYYLNWMQSDDGKQFQKDTNTAVNGKATSSSQSGNKPSLDDIFK